MKTIYILRLILCLVLLLSVFLAYAVEPAVSVAAAAPQYTAPTGITSSSAGSSIMDKSTNGLYMVYLPKVSRLQRVGERLNIYESDSQTFLAGSPFHIAHGWLFDSPEAHTELFDFQLQVDGVYQEEDIIEMRPGESRLYVFNFSAGMTGIHVFTGHWIAPCWAIQDVCTNPDKIIEVRTSNVMVSFVP